MLPVPLNSSKMTSSMRLPVSDQVGGEDGQAAAFSMLPSGAEKAFRFVQSICVDAAGENLARMRTSVL